MVNQQEIGPRLGRKLDGRAKVDRLHPLFGGGSRPGSSAESPLHRDEPGWWREAVSVNEAPVVQNQRSTGINPGVAVDLLMQSVPRRLNTGTTPN